MTILEIGLIITVVFLLGCMYLLVSTNMNQEKMIALKDDSLQNEINYNKQLKAKILDAEKKAKCSNDVIEMLHDMKEKGAIFEITRIDRNDIFFHNGSVYR